MSNMTCDFPDAESQSGYIEIWELAGAVLLLLLLVIETHYDHHHYDHDRYYGYYLRTTNVRIQFFRNAH